MAKSTKTAELGASLTQPTDNEQLAEILRTLLSDPSFVRMLQEAAMAGGGGGQMDPMAQMRRMLGGGGPSGYVDNPLGPLMDLNQATRPGNGPYVQWMGGLSPGMSDSALKKIAIGANVGNLLSPGIGSFLSGLFGGKK
jgi:hypothetical protein